MLAKKSTKVVAVPTTASVQKVGIDVGAGQMKAVSEAGVSNTPTSIKWGRTPTDELVGGKSENTEWRVDDKFFTVGPNLNGVTTGAGAWYSSPARVAGAHHAIAKALGQSMTAQGCNLEIVFTTPYNQYYLASGEKNIDSITAQETAFTQFASAVGGLENCVVKAKCVSEGVAAVLDYRMTNDGELISGRETRSRILVVDIGFSTTELVDVAGLKLNMEYSTNVRLGIGKAFNGLKNVLPTGLDDHLVRTALHTGKVSIYGEEISVQLERDKVLSDLAEELLYWLQTHIVNPSNYQRILLVGGGATALAPYLTAESLFPDIADRISGNFIYVPESPELANARGAYKLAKKGI